MAKDVVIVGNPKSFALTAGKEYNVLARDGKKISIVNDNNITASYYLSVFRGEGKAVKPKEKAVVLPTVEEIMATFNYDIGEGNVSFQVQGLNHSIDTTLGNAGSAISCGIRQIFGLNIFIDVFTEYFEEEALAHLPAELRDTVIDAMFLESVKKIMQNTTNVGMFLASTNTDYAEFDRIEAQFADLTIMNHTRINPNTGNEIKVWVLDQQFEHQD